MTQVFKRLPQLLEHTLRCRPCLSLAPTIVRRAPVYRATIQPSACSLIRAQSLSTSRPTSFSSIQRPLMSESGEASEIIFSAAQPADLPNRLSKLSAWSITESRMGITRHFTFPTFNAAWRFMSIVADECKAKRHHPSWSNMYNKVNIEWTTHKPLGLSIKDVEMAELCDRIADEIGLKSQSPKAESVKQE